MGGSIKLPLWLRWSGLGTGVLTLAWLPIEDTNTLYLTILSIMWSAWTAGWLASRPEGRDWLAGQWRWALLGAGVGLGTAPVALGLVLLKAGMHAHGFLDFSSYQMTGMLLCTPIWMVVGGLMGLAISSMGISETD